MRIAKILDGFCIKMSAAGVEDAASKRILMQKTPKNSDNHRVLIQNSRLYTNNLKNWFLTASAALRIFCSLSRLTSRQWSLDPNKKSEAPPCQIPNSSSCLCILIYFFIRLITFPFAFLPLSWLHAIGNKLGSILYYIYPKYRKRALSNLALASDLGLSSEEIVKFAKASLQNLVITALEYSKLGGTKEITHLAVCENPHTAESILKTGKGIIFFCGHQANWELLFLEGTKRMPGVAIARPIKNRYLYRWVVSIREKFGGKIIPPANALKEGLRALKNGKFLGIVGDQGMPNSGFSSIFLGRKAWTSPLPALLSLRTGCPIIVATTRREKGCYKIHYSDPVWPTPGKEPEAVMLEVLAIFEKSIKERPGEWLWIHNRWKQQLPGRIKKPFRQDAICIIFPDDLTLIASFVNIRKIYPSELLTVYIPDKLTSPLPADIEVKSYRTLDEILIPDYRFKLVFNLYITKNKRIKRHFLRLSAFHVQHLNNFDELCQLTGFTQTLP